jgi:hypothetical protein
MMTRLALLFALLCAVATAAAQKMDPFDFHVADVGILQVKQVQAELKVTEAQRGRMNQQAERHRTRVEAYLKKMESEKKQVAPDDKTLMGYFRDLKQGVLAVLQPNQLKRLREISLQRAGLSALTDQTVAKRVGMSDAQLKRMRDAFTAGMNEVNKLQQDAFNGVMKKYENRKPKDEAEANALRKQVEGELQAAGKRIQPQVDKALKSTETRMLAVLDSKQQASWKSLQGAPFRG